MAAMFHSRATVAAPGTAVALASGSEPVPAIWIGLTPCTAAGAANAGEVRLGGLDSLVAGAIPAGNGWPLANNAGPQAIQLPAPVDLRSVYVDATNAGDGVAFAYAVR
jgi:hypothetical protein